MHNKIKKYGRIIEFFLLNTKHYAYIELIECQPMQLPLIGTVKNTMYSILADGLFGRYFKSINLNNNFLFIQTRYIKNKCLIVNNILTEIMYDFEHD